MEGTRWTSASCPNFKVDWCAFAKTARRYTREDVNLFGVSGWDDLELPAVSMLVSATARAFHILREWAGAPTQEEVADRIAAIRDAAQRLARLAQGGSGDAPNPDAGWWLESPALDVEQREMELSLASVSKRSASMHPEIQDGIDKGFPRLQILDAGEQAAPNPSFLRFGALVSLMIFPF